MIAIVQQVDAASALLKQEREQRGIRLGRVTGNTGKDEIVRPVVGRLAAPGPDVVKRDYIGRGCLAAIGADGAMTLKKPLSMGLEGSAWGPLK